MGDIPAADRISWNVGLVVLQVPYKLVSKRWAGKGSKVWRESIEGVGEEGGGRKGCMYHV